MIHTRLCDILSIEHPIISAPMAGCTNATLAAAVSSAGGLGMIGVTMRTPDWIREQIALMRQRTDRPFGIGFITSAPDTATLMQVALEERVPVIAHSFADAGTHIQAAKQHGIKTIVQVQSVAQARAAADAGADVIAAQGNEAGGHTGMRNSTLVLVPAVIDAIGDVPVVAAGGIADGRGLAAVLMLGAVGAWMGTRFVASHEATAPEFNKEQIVRHGIDDFILTRVYDIVREAPFPNDIGERILRNAFTDTWHGRETEVERRRSELSAHLDAAAARGDTSTAHVLAGSGAGLIHDVAPADEIVRRIIAEAEHMLRTLPAGIVR